jgi:hypothetical protein
LIKNEYKFFIKLKMNDLQKIFEHSPNEDYNMISFMENSLITLDFIMKHPRLIENVTYFQFNPNCRMDFVDKFPDVVIDEYAEYELIKHVKFEEACANPVKYASYFAFTQNPDITFEMIKNNPQYKWNTYFFVFNINATWENLIELANSDLKSFAKHKNFDISILRDNPQIKFNHSTLTLNENLKLEDLESLGIKIDWGIVNQRSDITVDFLRKHKNKVRISPVTIQSNNITLADIENNLDLAWCWDSMHARKDINIDFIRRHKDKNFDWHMVSASDKFTMDDIINNPDLPWCFKGISSNRNVTIEFILENLDEPFDICELSCNSAITMQMVRDNPNIKWNFQWLSMNQNLTYEFYCEYIDEDWEYDFISSNFFDLARCG